MNPGANGTLPDVPGTVKHDSPCRITRCGELGSRTRRGDSLCDMRQLVAAYPRPSLLGQVRQVAGITRLPLPVDLAAAGYLVSAEHDGGIAAQDIRSCS